MTIVIHPVSIVCFGLVIFCIVTIVIIEISRVLPQKEVQQLRTEHIVLFRFCDTVTSREKREVVERLFKLKESLKNNVPYIQSIEYGPLAPQAGFDVAFRMVFNNEKARNYYTGGYGLSLPGTYDRRHAAFKAFVAPYLRGGEGVLVFDYNTSLSVKAPVGRVDRLLFFKFRRKVKKKAIERLFADMGRLTSNGSPLITGLDYGWQNSKEGFDKGYHAVCRIAYASFEARNHHIHMPSKITEEGITYQAFLALMYPYLKEGRFLVIDYKVKDSP